MTAEESQLTPKEIVERELEKVKAERERVIAQRNQLNVRRGEMEQQDQELVKQMIRLDGEVLAHSKLLEQFA